MKECYLYKKIKDKKTLCQTCSHFCLLCKNEKGKCGVKKNINGTLYSLNYGKVVALNIDPIEKKPFYHFYPGTFSLSLGCAGCSFSCKNCQNWSISQTPKAKKQIEGKFIAPEKIIKITKENKLPTISYTYTDPLSFFEYTFDVMKLAKEEKIKNCLVTHGFMSKKSLLAITPYTDAVNIDIKGFSRKFYKKNCLARIEPVLHSAIHFKRKNVWVEITTLIIPKISDSEKMFDKISSFIYNKLGPETPWHISQFSGEISWKLKNTPKTPQKKLEKAREIGKKNGLKYVYIGNVPARNYQDTNCFNCKTLCINRTSFSIERYDQKGKCPGCNENLDIMEKNYE